MVNLVSLRGGTRAFAMTSQGMPAAFATTRMPSPHWLVNVDVITGTGAGSSAHGLLSTRGPMEGDEALLIDSNTARLMARPGAWRGFLVYADGHSDVLDGFYPEHGNFTRIIGGIPKQFPDNIFNADQPAVGVFNGDAEKLGGDTYLTHIEEMIEASEVNPYDAEFLPLHD